MVWSCVSLCLCVCVSLFNQKQKVTQITNGKNNNNIDKKISIAKRTYEGRRLDANLQTYAVQHTQYINEKWGNTSKRIKTKLIVSTCVKFECGVEILNTAKNIFNVFFVVVGVFALWFRCVVIRRGFFCMLRHVFLCVFYADGKYAFSIILPFAQKSFLSQHFRLCSGTTHIHFVFALCIYAALDLLYAHRHTVHSDLVGALNTTTSCLHVVYTSVWMSVSLRYVCCRFSYAAFTRSSCCCLFRRVHSSSLRWCVCYFMLHAMPIVRSVCTRNIKYLCSRSNSVSLEWSLDGDEWWKRANKHSSVQHIHSVACVTDLRDLFFLFERRSELLGNCHCWRFEKIQWNFHVFSISQCNKIADFAQLIQFTELLTEWMGKETGDAIKSKYS